MNVSLIRFKKAKPFDYIITKELQKTIEIIKWLIEMYLINLIQALFGTAFL